MDPSKKGWLKKAITHHLSLNTISYLENYRYPDEPIYHFIPPTGLVSDVAVAASRPVYGPGRFKLHLIRGIVNIYKLSQAQKDPYNLERCTRCIYTFYKGIFPGLATAGRSWLGRSRSLWSLCESIINKRMASLIKVEKYDVAAAFFDNAQLFMDTYLFRLYCTAEGDEMLLEYLRNQRDEITLTTLKVIAAASHANDLVAPGEQALFELFIKNNRLPEEKKRVAREYLVHGIGIQKIEVEDPGSWALRKFLLELAILTTWSDKAYDHLELSFINDFGDMLGLTGMDKDLSMLAVEGFFLNAWDEQNGMAIGVKEAALRETFMKRLSQLLLAHEDEMIHKITQNHHLVELLIRGSVSELDQDEKDSVHLSLVREIESLPAFRATKLPGRFLTYQRLSSILPKKIAQRILSQ